MSRWYRSSLTEGAAVTLTRSGGELSVLGGRARRGQPSGFDQVLAEALAAGMPFVGARLLATRAA